MKRTYKTSKQPSRGVPPFLAGLVSVTLMITVAWAAMNHARVSRGAPAPGSTPAGWYWQNGQWRADFRTLAAVVDFLVMPNPHRDGPIDVRDTNVVASGTNTHDHRCRAALTEEQLEALRNALRVRLLS